MARPDPRPAPRPLLSRFKTNSQALCHRSTPQPKVQDDAESRSQIITRKNSTFFRQLKPHSESTSSEHLSV
jgi:hypothetical protein